MPAKKITKLTAEQEHRLVDFRDEWLKIGLCCDPADFAAGDEVIRGFYRRLNKPEPMILHFSSPMMCELAVNVIFGLLKEGPIQLYSQLDSQLGSQLDSQLGSQLDSQLDSQLYSQLRSQLGSQLDKLKPYFLNNRWGSQHWCAWEAFYLFGHEIGVTYRAEDISLLLEWGRLSKSVGWWAPWDGICFVSDRPRHVQFDDELRLHREDGPAVTYSDGWSLYSWHGTRIPSEWIEKRESLTAKEALSQQNIELRRAALDIIGWHRALRELNAKVIDEHPDPRCGALVEVQLPDLDKPSRFIHAECGTGREFAIGVPPGMKTVIEAQAWLTGLPISEFQFPSVRT